MTRAIYAARLASGGLTVLLLVTAVWATIVGRRRRWSLLGMALAVSPMVIFLGATVSTNGVEIAAAVCFWAALLRVRLPDAPPVLWGAVAAGGVLMGLARQLDVVWLVCGGLTFLALLGPKTAWERVRAGGRWSAFCLGMVTTAGAVSLLWDVFGMPSPAKGGGNGVAPNVTDVESLAHQAVGVFGWLDTPIPTSIEQAWLVTAGALLLAAVFAGTWRERAVITGTLAGIALATVTIQMILITPFGYGMQTRYVMPYLVAVPILAGEILSTRAADRRGELIERGLIFGGLVLVGIGQWSGFYTNARRNGIGLHSSASLLSQSTWNPPGSTLLWLVVTAIGCSCFVLSGVSVLVARSPGGPSPI